MGMGKTFSKTWNQKEENTWKLKKNSRFALCDFINTASRFSCFPLVISFLLREVKNRLGRVVYENELAVRDGVMVVSDILGPRVDVEVDEAQVVSGEQLLPALDDVKHLVNGPRRRFVVPQDYVDVEDGDILLVRTVLGSLIQPCPGQSMIAIKFAIA